MAGSAPSGTSLAAQSRIALRSMPAACYDGRAAVQKPPAEGALLSGLFLLATSPRWWRCGPCTGRAARVSRPRCYTASLAFIFARRFATEKPLAPQPRMPEGLAAGFPVAQSRLELPQPVQERRNQMTNGPSLSLAELEQRIAIARDNIRQLIEQAAALSGAEDEDRNAD